MSTMSFMFEHLCRLCLIMFEHTLNMFSAIDKNSKASSTLVHRVHLSCASSLLINIQFFLHVI